jgi:superfamily II DNA or RNA helicase
MPHQKLAINQLESGKVLWGGVGSGKTATVLGYYVKEQMPKDIVVITTAKKRDSGDWIFEAANFGIGVSKDATVGGVITVDSWANIKKYTDREGCFFIFDEQRLVGNGAWVKSFQQIAKRNQWVLLSATPGDTWLDYAPIFIANGYYKNITEFKRRHVIYESYSRFPKIRGYLSETQLERFRNEILVEMPYIKHTKRVINWVDVDHDRTAFQRVLKDRWNPFEDRPAKDISDLFRLMRKVVNQDQSRLDMVRQLLVSHKKLIIFYNFNYELEALRSLASDYVVAEWNGHKKEPIPDTDEWVYLVQYVAGAEGWNCVETDAMVLYSLTYSYKNFQQALGRIDRLNSPFLKLFYYVLVSNTPIDQGIKRSLERKESFNELKFAWESDEIKELEPLI